MYSPQFHQWHMTSNRADDVINDDHVTGDDHMMTVIVMALERQRVK